MPLTAVRRWGELAESSATMVNWECECGYKEEQIIQSTERDQIPTIGSTKMCPSCSSSIKIVEDVRRAEEDECASQEAEEDA